MSVINETANKSLGSYIMENVMEIRIVFVPFN